MKLPRISAMRLRRASAPSGRRRPSLRVEVLEDRSLFSVGNTLARNLIDASQPFTRTEVVASIRSAQPLAALAAAAPGHNLSGLIDFSASQRLYGRDGTSTVQIGLTPGADPLAVVCGLQALSFVEWASPNFIYDAPADPRDFVPDDPRYFAQYHHPLMSNNLAWDYLLGSPSVVVAVTDDGVDLVHEDLYENIFVKQREIPATRLANLTDVDGDGLYTLHDLNDPVNRGPFLITDLDSDGRITGNDLRRPMQRDGGGTDLGGGGWANTVDDDGDGKVDDLVGWSTINNTNDTNPNGLAHGTHVAGISAAMTNNGRGVAGTAGGATIMPIRFYGGGSWTSTVIANSYAYAADNGAQIVTTSYSVDSFVSDPIFRNGLQYMYDAGVLHFNSAGNGSSANPTRQNLDTTLYVVSSDFRDIKSGFSNWGWGVDVVAPGDNVLSTLPRNAYGNNSGTSMASPNAAGVAALIWSAYPYLTRDQVAALLVGTGDNIDALNPAYALQLGGGRVNSWRALNWDILPPTFKRVIGLPAEGGSTSGVVRNFTIDLAHVFEPYTVNDLNNWEMREAGADGTFDTADDVLVPLSLRMTTGTDYMVGTNRLYFATSFNLPSGAYQFRAYSGGLFDPFGQPLDGDGDGVGGDLFYRTFFVSGPDGSGGGLGGDLAEVLPDMVVAPPMRLVSVPATLTTLEVAPSRNRGDELRFAAGVQPETPDLSTATAQAAETVFAQDAVRFDVF